MKKRKKKNEMKDQSGNHDRDLRSMSTAVTFASKRGIRTDLGLKGAVSA